MPDNQNPGTINSQPNVLKQNFATLQTVVNYGADAVNGEETENKFALQKDLNSLTKKANDLQGELSTLKGSGTGSVQSQISSALDKYAEITPKGNVYTISIGSGKSKASFVSPSVYEGSGDIAALAYGRGTSPPWPMGGTSRSMRTGPSPAAASRSSSRRTPIRCWSRRLGAKALSSGRFQK